MKRATMAAVAALAAALAGPATAADAPAACSSLVPALVGGPMPPTTSDTAVIRWLGTSNYEVAYRGKVYLFDTFYERPGRTRPIGFTVDQVRRADVIFIGHAHFDHISDIAPVARQTGALVVGAPITIAAAIKLGVPQAQTRVMNGGDSAVFGDLKVEAALARHSIIQEGLGAAHRKMYEIDALGPLTPAQETEAAVIKARGTFDPEVAEKGTLAFLLTLPGGLTLLDVDSAGPVTDGVRALAKKAGRVDVAIIAYQPHPVAEHQIGETWPYVEMFDPKLFLPSHHDHVWGAWLDLGVEPFFQKLRDERPQTAFIAPLYRSPVCVQATGPKRGTVLSVKY